MLGADISHGCKIAILNILRHLSTVLIVETPFSFQIIVIDIQRDLNDLND